MNKILNFNSYRITKEHHAVKKAAGNLIAVKDIE